MFYNTTVIITASGLGSNKSYQVPVYLGSVVDRNPAKSWPTASSNNHNRTGAHTFRITAAEGSQIGVNVVGTYCDHDHWKFNITFYINSTQVAYFSQVFVNSAVGHSSGSDDFYDIYLYSNESSDSVSEVLLNDRPYGSYKEMNLFTMPDRVVDISFTGD